METRKKAKVLPVAAELSSANIFIPSYLMTATAGIIVACYLALDSVLLINCMMLLASQDNDFSLSELQRAKKICRDRLKVHGLGWEKVCLAAVGSEVNFSKVARTNLAFAMHQRLGRGLIPSRTVVTIGGRSVKIQTIIVYDAEKVANSNLLGHSLPLCRISFLNFVTTTTKVAQGLTAGVITVNPDPVCQPSWLLHTIKERTYLCVQRFWIILDGCDKAVTLVATWIPEIVIWALKLTTTGEQVLNRLYHISSIKKQLQESQEISLSCCNLLVAILLDVCLGVALTYCLLHYVKLEDVLDSAMEHTDVVVNQIHYLLRWLMGVPAGLKLNHPLNSALGHFFSYHIYLWKTYMIAVKSVFAIILEFFVVPGILGLTFHLSLLSDLLSLTTIHIYCFYGYAARLYGLQVSGLAALWRLFRGKKWNPLRQRVDSYSYDIDQLFIGTLMFTILLFLLPTMVMYYIVFTLLRLLVLTVQGLIWRIKNLLSIIPAYVLFLRVIHSERLTGDVFLQVIAASEAGYLTLSMKTIQVPYMVVIQRTLPSNLDSNAPPSWKMLLHHLIWGKIIFPI